MSINNEKIKLIKSIEKLTNPTPKDKSIMKEIVASFGINTFLLNIEDYDISKTVKGKIIDLRNILDALDKRKPNDLNQGGGQCG